MSDSFNLRTNVTFDTNTNSYKIITSDPTNDDLPKKIGLGTYIIKGIEKEKPIAFRVLNNKNIKFHGLSNNLFTGKLKSPTNDQKRYHYYYGNVSLEVLDNFGSIEGYYFVKQNANNGLYTVETKNHKLVFDNNNLNGVNTKNYLELSEIDERKNNNFTYFGNKENGKSVKGFDTISSEDITYYSYITTIFDPEYSKHMCIRSNSIPNYTSNSVENNIEINDWETLTNQKGYDKQNFGYYNNGNRILGKSFKIPINPIMTNKKNIPSNILDSSMTGINSESFWFKNNQYWKEIMTDRNYENLNLSGDKNNTQNFPNSLTPLGPIGVAVNGIPIYNHFKMTDIVTNNEYTENYNSNSISADRILTLSELTFSRDDLVLSSNYDNYGGTIDINNNYYYNKYPVGLEAKIKLETVRNRSHNSVIYDKIFKDSDPDVDIYLSPGENSIKKFYFNISEDGFKDYQFKITNLSGTSVLDEKLKRINNNLEIIGIPGETYSSTLLLEIDNSKLFSEEETITDLEYLLQGVNNKLLFYDFVQGSKDKRIGDYKNISITGGSGIGLTVSFTVAPGIKGFSPGSGSKTNGEFNNVEVLAPLGFNYDSNTGVYSESRNGSGLKISYKVENNDIVENSIVITDVGSGYVLGETLTIQDELGHNDTTFKLTSEEGIIVENSVAIENIGIGYQVNDTITISNEETKGTANTTFKISDTGYIDINLHILKNSEQTNANKSKEYIYLKKHGTLLTTENNLRNSIFEGGIIEITNSTYTNLSTTTDGLGSGATLTIVVDTSSVTQNEGTITVTNTGQNYKVGDTLTVIVDSKTLKFTLTENNFVVDGIKKYDTQSFGNLTDYTGFLKNIDSNTGDIKKFMDYMKSIGGAQGHSPILGWAFDGFPIYGQIGFESNDGSTLKFLKSSYVNGKYKEGEGDLDFCNGIIKKTPEFPQGIYHYVCTLKIDNNNELDYSDTSYSDTSLYQYPYIIGAYKAIPDINNFLTPTVISTSSTTYETSNVENESSLIITNTKNYDINFRSLKGNEDFYNGSSASSVILSQDENTIYIQNSSKPYIWNFTGNRTILDERFGIDNSNFGDSVNNLTSNSNSVFKGYGNIAKFKYKPINTITKNNLNSLQNKIYTDFNTTSDKEGVELTVNFEINNNDIKDNQITISNSGSGYVHNEVITITIETGKTITFKLNIMLGQVVKFSNNENLLVEKNLDNSTLSLGIVLKEDLVNEYCYVITEGFAEVSTVNYNQQETLSLNNSLSFDNEGNIEKYKIADDLADNSKKCIIGTYVGKNNKNTIRNHLIKVNIHLIEG